MGFEISENNDDFEAEQSDSNITAKLYTPNLILSSTDEVEMSSENSDTNTGKLSVHVITAYEKMKRLLKAGDTTGYNHLLKLTNETDPEYDRDMIEMSVKLQNENEKEWDKLIPTQSNADKTDQTFETSISIPKHSNDVLTTLNPINIDKQHLKTQNTTFSVEQLLSKYKHVSTLGNLVNNFNDKNDLIKIEKDYNVQQPEPTDVTISSEYTLDLNEKSKQQKIL